MRGNLLRYGIIGTETEIESQPSFSFVMSQFEVQKLLLDIAESPRRPEFIGPALGSSGVSHQDLEDLGLIRREGEQYVLSFTLLTKADAGIVRRVGEQSARSLAADVLARRDEIESALGRYDVEGVDAGAAAFILLGCFSLDWDGLALAAERGYAATAPEDGYIPWAQERAELSLRAIYWGSHNEYLPDVVVTSFGDHFSRPRHALPDAIWRLELHLAEAEMPASMAAKLVGPAQQALNRMMGHAGRLTLALREGAKTVDELVETSGLRVEDAGPLMELLVELDYATQEGERYRATIPVFTPADRPLVDELRGIGERVLEGWMGSGYDELKEELSEITPMRFGVDFAETFTQIWHYIFGAANGQLVEAGLFADPYAEDRRYHGFIPCVWHPDVWRSREAEGK